MKRLVVLSCALAACVVVPLSFAQSGGMDMNKERSGGKSEVKVHSATGVVKKVDAAAGKVTIAHGPIPAIKWPAMTMTFSVKDKKALGKLAPEKKVQFQFVQQGSDYVITSIK